MQLKKQSITKEALISYVGEQERKFLDKVDRLNYTSPLSEGKWRKLYALIAEVRKITSTNVYVYESPNLFDYDTSCYSMYKHLVDGRTQVWQSLHDDPKSR